MPQPAHCAWSHTVLASHNGAIMGVIDAGRQAIKSACIVMIVLASASCEQPDLAAPTMPQLRVGDVAHAVNSPLPYRAGRYQERITQRGGVLDFGVGELVFPPGAVDREITIVANVDGRTVAVTLEPAGLTFPRAAQPILRFSVPPMRGTPRIYYVGLNNVIAEILPTRTNSRTSLETRLAHFSKYIFGVE